MKEKQKGRRSIAEIDIYVGSKIRYFRTRRGFSMTELGKALGFSYQQVHKYGNGEDRINLGFL